MEELRSLFKNIIGTKDFTQAGINEDYTKLQGMLGNETSDKILNRMIAFSPEGGDSWEEKLGKFLGSGDPTSTPPSAPNRIPLPDYKNPQSRTKYAQEWTKKYGPYMQGRGDTPLRINEVPNTQFDKLPVKQSATNAAKRLGLDPALFYSSAMEEGMSGFFKKGFPGEGYFNNSSYENFPVAGFGGFGLDTFGGRFNELVKKGYLPKEFEKKFQPNVNTNEKGESVQSADFRSVEDALQAKAAMIKLSQDQIMDYAKKNKIDLSPQAQNFFTLINYNAGEGSAQKMLQDYYKSGYLKNDAFLKQRPTKGANLKETSWKQPYENVIRRVKMADALKSEGLF